MPFELPGPEHWPERLQALLSTVEIAYAKAHEDAAGQSAHAQFSSEMLHLAGLLVELMLSSDEVRALAAQLHYAEARRPARVDGEGVMVPLAEQDPGLWRQDLIASADRFLAGAGQPALDSPRLIQALLQRTWCARHSLKEPAPWPSVLELYNRLLQSRGDPFVRLNRAVALAEIDGPAAALREVEALATLAFEGFLPFHAARADLLARTGRAVAARSFYRKALALDPGSAERLWLERRAAQVAGIGDGVDR